ncbi:MAG TPA: hypothetical protein VHV83_11995 [Armatimonadota bacterium]|nr:hypothetical protein [Armatimonadota bacterium]
MVQVSGHTIPRAFPYYQPLTPSCTRCHGKRIWAEETVDVGATLPQQTINSTSGVS